MAILKRINKYQGLKDIDVLIEESGLSSKYFNIYDVPTNIPQGRSSFLLAGSPFLKNFVELKVEILDSAGQTVYSEPVSNYLEGNARRISVEVYDDTDPGDGFLYIVGELKHNFRSVSGQQQSNTEITDKFLDPETLSQMGGNDIPPDFQNVYNVRYIRPIFINTVIPNSEPIFFYQQPQVTVSEIVKGYVTETTVSSSYEVTGSVSVDPIQGLESKDPEPDPIDGFSKGVIDGAREEVGRGLCSAERRCVVAGSGRCTTGELGRGAVAGRAAGSIRGSVEGGPGPSLLRGSGSARSAGSRAGRLGGVPTRAETDDNGQDAQASADQSQQGPG